MAETQSRTKQGSNQRAPMLGELVVYIVVANASAIGSLLFLISPTFGIQVPFYLQYINLLILLERTFGQLARATLGMMQLAMNAPNERQIMVAGAVGAALGSIAGFRMFFAELTRSVPNCKFCVSLDQYMARIVLSLAGGLGGGFLVHSLWSSFLFDHLTPGTVPQAMASATICFAATAAAGWLVGRLIAPVLAKTWRLRSPEP